MILLVTPFVFCGMGFVFFSIAFTGKLLLFASLLWPAVGPCGLVSVVGE